MSNRARSLFLSVLALSALAGRAPADEGMWLFNKPPVEVLKKKYGFEPSAAWLEHLQKSCVRFSTGGSGSIVSADGLVMTNHHVGSDVLQQFSTKEHDLLLDGFYAATPDKELPCDDLYLDCLWSIEDVTARVMGAGKESMSPAEKSAARRSEMSAIEKESLAATGLKSEIVTLYQGGRYHLYRYKTYTDVKLVMAPEKQSAFYGGDPDNFEYPRYCLDMCFFRIYENGKALRPEHFLRWSKQGVADQDLVFVAGHPGTTERLKTVDDLRWVRDNVLPLALQRLWRREVQMQTFAGRSAENARLVETDLFSVQNSRKARTGTLEGLLDPRVMGAKIAAERDLRAAVEADPALKAKAAGAWERLSASRTTAKSIYPRFLALGGSGMNMGSRTFAIAKDLVRLAAERDVADGKRLREYRDSARKTLEIGLYSPAPVDRGMEIDALASALSRMAEALGGEDPTVLVSLGGKSPRARAEELVLGTQLIDVAVRKRLAEGGAAAIAASTDPLIRLVRDLDPEARALRKRWEDEVDSVERECYAQIADARFAVLGDKTYPDATFTLRLSFGQVLGYDENGARVPATTRIGGIFERSAERKNVPPFELPEKWVKAKSALDASTPFNFVSTCDIIGGNSGSPVVDRAGDVVGLIFDGNIQSLIGGIAYTEEQARAVSVDSRAMIETLRKVYGAGKLADELQAAPAPQSGN
ncbi:MAG: S46 family peptidase [Planctomycetes bacterium]|nr:S46 family peptidase [Planctomycetota bacterium]